MMDAFGLTEEQLAIQTLAREFAQRHIKPIAAEIDRMEVGTNVAESFPWGLVEEAHKVGLKTIALPEESTPMAVALYVISGNEALGVTAAFALVQATLLLFGTVIFRLLGNIERLSV
jgi:alkylation response protein AidB-like acyl-CoA dehydrogenase